LCSNDFLNKIKSLLEKNAATVIGQISSLSDPSIEIIDFQFALTTSDDRRMIFSGGGGTVEADLHNAIGAAGISGIINVTVRVADKQVADLSIDLTITDLYDWDYTKTNRDALLAQIQAGAKILGDVGTPYKIKIMLQGPLEDFEFQF
jgi:hypothetical protein